MIAKVLVEKEPIDISVSAISSQDHHMSRIDFAYNIVLLPTVTVYNYLPYTINYEVDNIGIDVRIIILIT